ncbi:DNA-binding MarR family transcriptional regulator [Rhizobium sullae]|uniref:DNA-binding MarR family transcriptional regulator n=2 Tax=Rhizobium sullae TaxID=50338 RepID=A0A4R3Q480_RHISU|nr:DNA-binding MarR family transcriptional regulator [Rhizobium sullae]
MVTNVTVYFVTIKEAMDTGQFDLEQFLPFRLNRAAEFIALRFAAAYKAKYGLTRPEWRTLAALGSSGRMTAKEVGVHSTMHKTKVSRAVFSLEKRRWLKRAQHEDDRRVEHLELTAAGRNTYRELTMLACSYSAEVASLLGQDGLQALSSGLTAVEAAMVTPRH